MERKAKTPLKVSVIGSGIAGLSAAWLLTQHGHEVHLYEKYETVGLGAHSVEVGSCGDVVDVPIRVFVEGFYTELLSLFGYVGIETVVASASPSIQVFGQNSHFLLRNALFTNGMALPYLRPLELLKNLSSYWSIFKDLFYFKKATFDMQKNEGIRASLSRVTLAEYLVGNNYSSQFIDGFLIPIFAIVSTSSAQDSRNYPVTVVMDYVNTLLMTGKSTQRMASGTKDTGQVLAKNIKVKHINVKVTRIQPIRSADNQLLGVQVFASGLPMETFDHVVVATQANQALKLLPKDSLAKREEILRGFKYVCSEVVVHSDERLMPYDQSSWSCSNIFVQPDIPETRDCKTSTNNSSTSNHNSHTGTNTGIRIEPTLGLKDLNEDGLDDCSPGGAIMCTVWHNKVQPLKMNANSPSSSELHVFQTWNPWVKPRPDKVMPDGYHYFERPIVTLKTANTLRQLNEIQGCDNIWFVGAYSLPGVPLLENGANSGLLVAEKISGKNRPWKQMCKTKNSVPIRIGMQRNNTMALITILGVFLIMSCILLYAIY